MAGRSLLGRLGPRRLLIGGGGQIHPRGSRIGRRAANEVLRHIFLFCFVFFFGCHFLRNVFKFFVTFCRFIFVEKIKRTVEVWITITLLSYKNFFGRSASESYTSFFFRPG